MKHLCKYILSLLLLLTTTALSSQQPSTSALHFFSLSYDYGHIAEEGGSVRCSFEAENRGYTNIDILNIVTTCGCTSATYEQRSVAPGERFRFEVSYDPMNRPGRIDKHIFVHTSDSSDPIKLHIKGYVQPRERTIDELYPFDMGGGLRLISNFHAFGYLEHGKSIERQIGYANASDRTITLSLNNIAPSGLLEIIAPTSIAPHTSGDITLRYTADIHASTYGTVEDRIQVKVDGQPAAYDISTLAIVVDNFDVVDDISAPRLAISKNIIKFGEVNDYNAVMKLSVELHNEGESPLAVRAIESGSAAVRVQESAGFYISPGASHRLTVELHSTYIDDRDNPFVTRVTIVTNDPVRPMQTIRVSALPQ